MARKRPRSPFLKASSSDRQSAAKVSRALIAAVADWEKGQGCSELASDAEIRNRVSHRVHKGLGFQETERVVCFNRRLT